jgi:hypothetical protein
MKLKSRTCTVERAHGRFVPALVVLLALAASSAGGASAEVVHVKSVGQACERLKQAAVKAHLATDNQPSEYWCDDAGSNGDYFIIDLHYGRAHGDGIYSTLIGWFAVLRKTGEIRSYNINCSKVVPFLSDEAYSDCPGPS